MLIWSLSPLPEHTRIRRTQQGSGVKEFQRPARGVISGERVSPGSEMEGGGWGGAGASACGAVGVWR